MNSEANFNEFTKYKKDLELIYEIQKEKTLKLAEDEKSS